jgi:hypothetical protein
LITRTEEAAEAAEAVPEVAEAREAAEVAEEVLPEVVPRVDKDREETYTCLRMPSPPYERLKFKSTTNEEERPSNYK